MYRKRNAEWLRHLEFKIVDLAFLISVYLVVEWFRWRDVSVVFDDDNLQICVLMIILDMLLIFFTLPYRNIVQRDSRSELFSVFKHFTSVEICLLACLYLEHRPSTLPRLTLLIYWAITILGCYGIHTLIKSHIRGMLRTKEGQQLVLFTDAGHLVDTYRNVTYMRFSPYRIAAVCFVEDEPDPKKVMELRKKDAGLRDMQMVWGSAAIEEYLRTSVVDEAYIDQYDDFSKWEEVINELLTMGVVVHMGLAGLERDYPNSLLNHWGKGYVITTMRNSAADWHLNLKRVLDICGALVGLLLTGIAGIFIVPAIKLADPGPVIFSQTRIGTNGRPFKFFKFRSMYMDAEERKAELMKHNQMQGLMFKMENDPRIIGSEKGPGKGLGNFLRKTSLDELPQFWNVLIGDMSLVGTRPPTAGEYEQYDLHHKVRLSMKPGITGLWQVSGRSDITDFEEVVRLDAEYIENWNFALDIKILLKTIMVVFQKEGSR